MAVFKCKMCDGNLNVVEGHTICVCPYCDTQQTVPSDSSEKKVNLFNRANRLRCDSEFDKAASVYENIVAEFKEEAEAYWGLCLCKYGIEYVDDPSTGKKMPTCHRTSYDSIFDDKNFDQACEYADSDSLPVYRAEAKEIDRLQKEILEIAKNEEPFDVFICYKETAEDGNRTKDSVLAQDIFEALASKGYKVFFARITLEDKLGQDYEPYIFSALNSAKVMLAIGTSFEHFNAVWVKNEWSRFLSLMQTDKSKTLIPCYCDIDAYDMPKEFSRLQGQDMSKVGFIQDLVRGVGKIIPRGSGGGGGGGQPVIQVTGQQAIEPLLERAFMFLGNNDWQAADEQSERVLDIDPHCGRAYLVKLLVQYNCRREEELANLSIDVTESIHYKNARQFGVNIEQYVRKAKFNTGCRLMADCSSYKDLKTAKMLFEETSDIENSPEKLVLCEEKLALAEEITSNLQRVYGSFDPDVHTENNEALTNVREMKKKIETTYPKFLNGDIKEPWGPSPLTGRFIPLGIGALVIAFFTLFKPLDFAGNDPSLAVMLSVIGVTFITALGGVVGFSSHPDGLSKVLVVVGVIAGIFAVGGLIGLVDGVTEGAETDEKIIQGLAPIGVLFLLAGIVFIGISALLITLYLKKSGFIKRYYRDSETLEDLAATMKNEREAAILAERAKHPDFKDSFLDECVEEALATYKEALGALPNPAAP